MRLANHNRRKKDQFLAFSGCWSAYATPWIEWSDAVHAHEKGGEPSIIRDISVNVLFAGHPVLVVSGMEIGESYLFDRRYHSSLFLINIKRSITLVTLLTESALGIMNVWFRDFFCKTNNYQEMCNDSFLIRLSRAVVSFIALREHDFLLNSVKNIVT